MLKIKNITAEQAIEIAKLIYPEKWVVEGVPTYEFSYQPYDPSWFEDAAEIVIVDFVGVIAGNTTGRLRLEIHAGLDCTFRHIPEKGKTGFGSLGVTNQHAIQKKFLEWEELYRGLDLTEELQIGENGN